MIDHFKKEVFLGEGLMNKIKTGADKLVSIIQETGRISLEDASKALGVNSGLVQEWAEFLEKEKVISIDYSFSKVFFTERKLSSGEIKSSAKEVVYEKDAFVRKLEYALSSLDREVINFNEIKKKFNSVHGEVKDEIKTVEKELSELKKYDDLKTNIDKEIEAQKAKYEKEIEKLSGDIKSREDEYVEIYTKIIAEREKVNDHKSRLESIRKAQKEISDSISSANSVLLKLKDDLRSEEDEMASRLKVLHKLDSEFDDLNNRLVKDKKTKISNVLSALEKESSQLLERQNKLLDEAKKKAAKLGSYKALEKNITDSFKGFFNKTIAISKKIDEIDIGKDELKNNLVALKNKAEALNLMSSNEKLKAQASELDAQIKKQEQAKNNLVNKIKSLLEDLKL